MFVLMSTKTMNIEFLRTFPTMEIARKSRERMGYSSKQLVIWFLADYQRTNEWQELSEEQKRMIQNFK